MIWNVIMFSSMTSIFTVSQSISGKRSANRLLDHIVHHVLSLYALGASPEQIKAAYDRDSSYQRPVMPTKDEIVKSLSDKAGFTAAMGKEENYPNFLAFFQREISRRGLASVLKEHLFSRDECAESMMSRLFGGEY